ncbi:MAG: otsB [Polaromonas sp.]|jgi:trehalose 6-phosphate phosphatase|nr:otsB [Polaromonas sp.]
MNPMPAQQSLASGMPGVFPPFRPAPSSFPPDRTVLPVLTAQTALFLDFDGTLADIATEPELVVVPDDLIGLLEQLSIRLDGALALVSGRKITDLDGFLSPLRLPTAAEHGAQQRMPSGDMLSLAAPPLHEVIRVAQALASQHTGLRVEIKSAAVAVHYRHAPELETFCLQALAEIVKITPGVELMQGKCVFEVKPSGISKGSAMQLFMSAPPFSGRLPLFAGDDTTDEAGFAAVQAMGGAAIKVGEGISLAVYRCASPAQLRQWLRSSLQALDKPEAAEVTAHQRQVDEAAS